MHQAEVGGEEVETLCDVAIDAERRDARDVFHEPPSAIGFCDQPAEMGKHFETVTGRRATAGARKILARRATDDAFERVGRRCECPDILSKNEVGTAHDAKTVELKAAPEKIGTGKK